MKIAVDASSIFQAKKTGIGSFAETLLPQMKTQAPDIEWLLYSASKADFNTPRRMWWESARIPLKALRDKPDLVYSPGFAPPLFCPVPSVVTVHDLIGMAFRGNQGAVSSFYWSQWLPAAVRRARRIVASSEWTRRDIEKYLKIPGERVTVVPLAADPSFQKKSDPAKAKALMDKYAIRPPFYICVGTLEPRKNHLRLLQAYAQLKREKKNRFSLVIVGKPGAAADLVNNFAKENSLERDVIFLGYLSQEELICLYNAALGYVMISLYEGFGLPVLEAMSCGLSGVCSNRSSLPEVAGDTAISVDPESVDGIARALEAFWGDEARRTVLAQAAWQRSRNFSMAECAKKMIEIFRDEAKK